jgi:hypothetical protein
MSDPIAAPTAAIACWSAQWARMLDHGDVAASTVRHT